MTADPIKGAPRPAIVAAAADALVAAYPWPAGGFVTDHLSDIATDALGEPVAWVEVLDAWTDARGRLADLEVERGRAA